MYSPKPGDRLILIQPIGPNLDTLFITSEGPYIQVQDPNTLNVSWHDESFIKEIIKKDEKPSGED